MTDKPKRWYRVTSLHADGELTAGTFKVESEEVARALVVKQQVEEHGKIVHFQCVPWNPSPDQLVNIDRAEARRLQG